MVTSTIGTLSSYKPEATFITHYTSLGKRKDRWCITLPKSVSTLLDKRRTIEVTIRPLGTIG